MSHPHQVDPALLEEGGLVLNRVTLPGGLLVTAELAREKALNAVIPATFHALHAILDTLDPNVPSHLLILGRGRAFCAGGDVRSLRSNIKSAGSRDSLPRQTIARQILKTEYDFLERLHALRITSIVTVAFANGFAFGAGAGIFQACRIRLISERAALSMPECIIGLVPDCGASHFLTALPGGVGMFAALTGVRFVAADILALGLADGVVGTDWKGEGLTTADGPVDMRKTLSGCSMLCDADSELRRWIDRCFGMHSLQEVITAVQDERRPELPEVQTAVTMLQNGSPSAVHATWMAMKEGYQMGGGLAAAVRRELEANVRLAAAWDFEEGVRAALVDKDRSPKWAAFP